ncbi:MAG: 4Fe-4S binding protein [Capsulimonadaceae bacterium]|nr:4Fe-4S binding protein [Capsulimonadaceae bacterium]
MVYVITSACAKDDICASGCPEEAISSGTITVDGTEYDQFFIDPTKCSDCGSCEASCPEMAIFSEDDLPAESKSLKAVNAAFFKQ